MKRTTFGRGRVDADKPLSPTKIPVVQGTSELHLRSVDKDTDPLRLQNDVVNLDMIWIIGILVVELHQK